MTHALFFNDQLNFHHQFPKQGNLEERPQNEILTSKHKTQLEIYTKAAEAELIFSIDTLDFSIVSG